MNRGKECECEEGNETSEKAHVRRGKKDSITGTSVHVMLYSDGANKVTHSGISRT